MPNRGQYARQLRETHNVTGEIWMSCRSPLPKKRDVMFFFKLLRLYNKYRQKVRFCIVFVIIKIS